MKTALSVFCFLCLALCALPAFAAKEYAKESVDAFCLDQRGGKPRSSPPAQGVQFDGKPAPKAVMDMAIGEYSGRNGSALYLYHHNRFLLRFPGGVTEIKGTGGDDMIAPGMLGGCSREQLSEALSANGLDPAGFKLEVITPPIAD